MKNTKSAVLACVTSQYNCDRIIRIAKEIADSSDCELRVMSVLKPMSDYSAVSDEIDYLYLIAKESGADMTVMFSDDAPKVTAEFVRDNNVERIVTGMHDGKDNSFLVKFNELSPATPITMVSKDNMVYLSANLRTSNEDSPSYIYKYPDDFGDFSPRQALDLCIDGKEIRPPQR